jgi:uncharacterized protein VirK/YbjX
LEWKLRRDIKGSSARLVPALAAADTWIISTATAYTHAGRHWLAEQYHAARSIYAGTAHLIHKLWSRDTTLIISKFGKSVSGEPMAVMLVRHLEVVRTLNRCGARALTKSYPNYANKYATHYLAKSLGKNARREILKFHHYFLSQRVTEQFYDEILKGGKTLWQETIDENRYTISLSFNPQFHSEGDISLIFGTNDRPLYELSFSIVPGKEIGSASEQVLLIGRVQGRIGESGAIKVSTKAFHDIAPPHLLLAAALSIADALSIDAIAGVGNDDQLAKSSEEVSGCYFDYDAFWNKFFFNKNAANIYEAHIPLPEKPLEQFRRDHRRRAVLKRRIKKQIAEHAGATFAKDFLKSPGARAGVTSKLKVGALSVFSSFVTYHAYQLSDLFAFG